MSKQHKFDDAFMTMMRKLVEGTKIGEREEKLDDIKCIVTIGVKYMHCDVCDMDSKRL